MMLRTPPYGAAVDAEAKTISAPWMQWFDQLYKFLTNSVVDYTGSVIIVPVTGFTFVIPDKTQVLTLDPSGGLASGTIQMPPSPLDGQPLQVSSTAAITALTLSPNSGQTVKNPPTTLLAGVGFSYYYHAANATWYRLS